MAGYRSFTTEFGEPLTVCCDASGLAIEFTCDGQDGFLWLMPTEARGVALALLAAAMDQEETGQ